MRSFLSGFFVVACVLLIASANHSTTANEYAYFLMGFISFGLSCVVYECVK